MRNCELEQAFLDTLLLRKAHLRWFLAEILKQSPIQPEALIEIIARFQVQPAWLNIVPPIGMSQLTSLDYETSASLISRAPQEAQIPHKGKRPISQVGEPLTPGERVLQPRPPVSFTSVNAPASGSQSEPSSQQRTPGSVEGAPGPGLPRKKRGRPNKEEQERRVAEAAARGEIYPPPKKVKTPRLSTEGGVSLGDVGGAAAVGGGAGSGLGSGSSGTGGPPSGMLSPTTPKMAQNIQPKPGSSRGPQGGGGSMAQSQTSPLQSQPPQQQQLQQQSQHGLPRPLSRNVLSGPSGADLKLPEMGPPSSQSSSSMQASLQQQQQQQQQQGGPHQYIAPRPSTQTPQSPYGPTTASGAPLSFSGYGYGNPPPPPPSQQGQHGQHQSKQQGQQVGHQSPYP
ncbi:hypothetical protein MMC25_003836 [Agyrium rufum]|nr:hypothetical protein [Agyrium rufum]